MLLSAEVNVPLTSFNLVWIQGTVLDLIRSMIWHFRTLRYGANVGVEKVEAFDPGGKLAKVSITSAIISMKRLMEGAKVDPALAVTSFEVNARLFRVYWLDQLLFLPEEKMIR